LLVRSAYTNQLPAIVLVSFAFYIILSLSAHTRDELQSSRECEWPACSQAVAGLILALSRWKNHEKVLIVDLCYAALSSSTSTSPPVAPLRPISQAGHEVILLCEKDPGAIQVSGKPWSLGNTSE
jgi:hypothetical protein